MNRNRIIIVDEISSTSNYSAFTPAAPKSKPPENSGASASIVTTVAADGLEAESRKLPSSRFKGVVPQPNGRWGAQIYEKHHRVWLGTFNLEDDAARAYDAAALRFRGRDALSNFKRTHDDEFEFESNFLNSHSKSEIVDMLRKHTYNEELSQSRSNWIGNRTENVGKPNYPFAASDGSGRAREQLFEKSVTPSDVGKLNRLVIPKQFAEKHFPLHIGAGAAAKGVLLSFEDGRNGKVWRFRYSYWNSSQSYVLTKGWSRFVKEKNLRAGDVVSFQRSIGLEKKLYIDWKARRAGPEVGAARVRVVRLFGVNIFGGGGEAAVHGNVCGGKRGIKEVAGLGFGCGEKRRIVAL